MNAQLFNQNWKFWVDKNAFALVWSVPDHAKDVTLPHDAMLEERAYADSPNQGKGAFRDGVLCRRRGHGRGIGPVVGGKHMHRTHL